MSKTQKKAVPGKKKLGSETRVYLLEGLVLIVILVMGLLIAFFANRPPNTSNPKPTKLDLLAKAAVTQDTLAYIKTNPAGEEAQYVVFLSLCDKENMASVYHGTGKTLVDAWNTAIQEAAQYKFDICWAKTDIVSASELISSDSLDSSLAQSASNSFRFGLAFDENFETALLEEELNAVGVYDYDDDTIDVESLSAYCQHYHIPVPKVPADNYIAFRCISWVCDEDDQVYRLNDGRYNYGTRKYVGLDSWEQFFNIDNNALISGKYSGDSGNLPRLDKELVTNLVINSAQYLARQVNADGSFVYEYYPRVDQDSGDYDLIRHAGTVWAMRQAHNINPDAVSTDKIGKATEYMCDTIIYDEDGRAYLYDEKWDEICLGGNALAILALTESIETNKEEYEVLAIALGDGILSMFDGEAGEFIHTLNKDFTVQEKFRTVYYDGEATLALFKLYDMTQDSKWLDAAQKSVEHFIEADYTQYCDHWVSYCMNEATKRFPGRQDYYEFALKNITENTGKLSNPGGSAPVYLELLMNTYEVYNRMLDNGITASSFNGNLLPQLISLRVECQLSAYFFPEIAMYMRTPSSIANTFMTRTDSFRVRIDDVQHNIGGFSLFLESFEELQGRGIG